MAPRRSQRAIRKAARDIAETNAFFRYRSGTISDDAEENHSNIDSIVETSNKIASLEIWKTSAPSQDTSVHIPKSLLSTATESVKQNPDTSLSNHEDTASQSSADRPVYSTSTAVGTAAEVKFPFGHPNESKPQRVIGSEPVRSWEELTSESEEVWSQTLAALRQKVPQTPEPIAQLSTALKTLQVCTPRIPNTLYTPLQEGTPSRTLHDIYYDTMLSLQKDHFVPFLRQAADRIEKAVADGGLTPPIENILASALREVEDTGKSILDDSLKVGIDKKERRAIKKKLQKDIKKIRKIFGDIVSGPAEPRLLRILANSFEADLSEETDSAAPPGKSIRSFEDDCDKEDKTATSDGALTRNNVADEEDIEGVADDDGASDADRPYALLDRELTSNEEELVRGKNFHYLCSLIGIAMVFRVVDLEGVLQLCEVGEDGHVDPKRVHPKIIAAVELRLMKMAEETGHNGKYWHNLVDTAEGSDEEEADGTPELIGSEVEENVDASGKLKGRAAKFAPDINKDAPAVPGDRASDATMLNLMSNDLAALVIAKTRQCGPSPSVLPMPAEVKADLIEASKASRDPVKKKTPWDKLRRALALCEESLREPLVSYFEKDPDFVRNIPTYAKFCLKTRNNCAPKLYDDLRVLLWANSVQRVQERMRKEKEEGSHAEPAFGREAVDDPIVRRLKTLKRDWPTVEGLMEKLYMEWKEANEST